MKRAMSRGEWLLITSPLAIFGLAAALYVRWKGTAPAVLNPAPVPLSHILPAYDGKAVFGIGVQLDARNNPKVGAPLNLLHWDTKDGRLSAQFSELRRFRDWNLSRDGELLAFYVPGKYNLATKSFGAGTIVVKNVTNGAEIFSWPIKEDKRPSSPIVFSPDSREIIVLNEKLKRYDLNSGKLLGSLNASQIFSPTSFFARLNFSPDGRTVALIEDRIYQGGENTHGQVATTSGETLVGGRMAVVDFPSLRPIFCPQGDLYADSAWESNHQLWAIATLQAGYNVQRFVRAHINVPTKRTQLDMLQAPTEESFWNRETLSINGPTGQVVCSDGQEHVMVWGRDGQLKTTFNFPKPQIAKGVSLPAGSYAPPRFSHDGRSLFRIKDKNIERYDLSRYLPESSPTPAP